MIILSIWQLLAVEFFYEQLNNLHHCQTINFIKWISFYTSKGSKYVFPFQSISNCCGPAQFLLLELQVKIVMREEVDDIECVFESMGARGSIYISNFSAAQNTALLKSKGIKAVLSVARSGLLCHPKEDIPLYLYIPMEDHEQFQISKYFATTYEFIERGRRESNVLIHCMVGVSRSVTIAIAYLLRKYQYTLAQVISLLQRKRRKINPNPGFLLQLQKYSESLGIKCDFYEKKVPPLREHSASRQAKAYSLRKQRTPLKIAEPLTPIPHVQKEKSKQIMHAIPYNQDLRVKLQGIDLKKIKSYEDKSKIDEGQHTKRYLNDMLEKIDLKKSISIDEGKQRKRSSIEEKISKIRQKILKTQQFEQTKANGGYFQMKENSYGSKRIDSAQRNSRLAQEPSFRHIFTPTKDKREDRQFRETKLQSHQRHNNHFNNYLQQSNNKQLFSAQLKIQSKAFYMNGCRQNPRFMRPKEQLNN